MADTYELLLKLGADVGEIKNARFQLVGRPMTAIKQGRFKMSFAKK